MHYSLSNTTKTNHLPSSSPSNMALNFSHDLLLQTSHQGQSSSLNSSNSGSSSSNNNNNNNNHHTTSSNHTSNNSSNNDNNGNSSNSVSNTLVAELKHNPLAGSLELDPTNSHQLMQSAAAGMNMWKSTMAAASFLPNPSDMNTFSNWTHGNGLGGHHQATPSMTHHILDGQNLIAGYSQHNHHHHNHHHQRPTTIQQLQSQQVDLVGASLKSHATGLAAGQASFMLNSINQQVQSANSQAATSGGGIGGGGAGGGVGHHHSGSHQDSTADLHLSRSQQQLDHNAATTSYNLSMNDNQFYTTQSHVNTIKSSVFLHDRSGAGSHSNHLAGQLSYHNAAAAVAAAEHLNPQPGTSGHPLAGTSGSSGGGGSSSSKNIGNFRCPHCSEMFNMRNLYQSHLKSHSQDKGSKAKFHCELCGHSFSQKTSLNRHMKSHTGERPFPCEVCGKAFSEKERLKIHMRTHTGEKPFSCGICGKSFSQKSTVKRHQTVHTGEKKFKCDCGKGFANRGNLIAHIKTRGSNHFE